MNVLEALSAAGGLVTGAGALFAGGFAWAKQREKRLQSTRQHKIAAELELTPQLMRRIEALEASVEDLRRRVADCDSEKVELRLRAERAEARAEKAEGCVEILEAEIAEVRDREAEHEETIRVLREQLSRGAPVSPEGSD